MDSLLELLKLDSKTMIGILIWCNLGLSILIFGYRFNKIETLEKHVLTLYGYAKLTQGISWMLLFLRPSLPLLVSRFIGNNILFIGFYLEALVMLAVVRRLNKKSIMIQTFILIISCTVFNLLQTVPGDYVYVILASLITIFIFIYPTCLFMMSHVASRFSKYLGYAYIIFLFIMVFRATFSYLNVTMYLFEVNYIQNFSFITLILLTVVSGPGFLLVLKEEADKNLRALATLDGLTMISNRRSFIKEAEIKVDKHKKTHSPLSILFIDIDHFKAANDKHGHAFGDEVLVHLAQTLKGAVRGNDLVCRYGGEEFIVLLSETELEGAKVVIHHLQDQIRHSVLSIEDFKYSISIGLYAAYPDETLYEMIKKADEAVYQAKQQGRNQYIVYGE